MTEALTLGFIGTGGITSFIVRGLCSAPEFTGKIVLSVHKNRDKAETLKALFPDRITISGSNQEVADFSDVVFIAVLPQQHKAVAEAIKFKPEHRVVHITGGVKLADSLELYAPAMSAVRAIPLPFAARRMGPVLFYGKDQVCRELLATLGAIVEVQAESELDVLGPVTGMMVPYYALIAEYVKLGMARGLSFRTALDYAGYMNEALSSFMRTDCGEDIEAFLVDNSTPGGVNELGLRLLREGDSYSPWSKTLDALYVRYNSMGKNME
ncbi:MAG: NAD(P)-binding domain-containing protein [Synergistaceae bacterium]|nr:NAD(P)-binding domain-containing protein [Synergistaceae bacterium]